MAENEKLLTRYLILSTDEAAVAFTRIGEVLASGSEDAIRKFQSDPPVEREGFLVAVSENSFKLRRTRAKVTTSLTDVEIPDLAAAAPAEEPGQEALGLA